jgi:hypothetical protein
MTSATPIQPAASDNEGRPESFAQQRPVIATCWAYTFSTPWQHPRGRHPARVVECGAESQRGRGWRLGVADACGSRSAHRWSPSAGGFGAPSRGPYGAKPTRQQPPVDGAQPSSELDPKHEDLGSDPIVEIHIGGTDGKHCTSRCSR